MTSSLAAHGLQVGDVAGERGCGRGPVRDVMPWGSREVTARDLGVAWEPP